MRNKRLRESRRSCPAHHFLKRESRSCSYFSGPRATYMKYLERTHSRSRMSRHTLVLFLRKPHALSQFSNEHVIDRHRQKAEECPDDLSSKHGCSQRNAAGGA